MAATPGLIALTANVAAGYGAATTNATINTLYSLIGLQGNLNPQPAWLLAGVFKGIFQLGTRPVPSALNSGDYYFDVARGAMLATDGVTWFNILSTSVPPI
jgi:hypothetical protein